MITTHNPAGRFTKMRNLGMKCLLVSTTAAVVFAGVAGPASAAPSAEPKAIDLSAESVAQLTDTWTQYGVATEVQQRLIEKFEAGGGLDSMSSASPVSSKTTKTDLSIDTVNTFADGSISAFSVERPAKVAKGGVSTNAVGGCSGGGTGNIYTGCSVTGTFGVVSLGFYAGYTLSSTGNARINSWTSGTSASLPGVVVSAPAFEVIRQVQSGSTAAQVNLTTNWSYVTVGGGGTTRLEFRVKGLQAYTN